MGVFGELFEEESEEGIDVLSGGNGVRDGRARIGEAGVHGLVKEDDAGVGVPAVGVTDDVNVGVDRGWTEFKEETGKGGAAGTAVDPKDDRVVLGIVAGFEEPWHSD